MLDDQWRRQTVRYIIYQSGHQESLPSRGKFCLGESRLYLGVQPVLCGDIASPTDIGVNDFRQDNKQTACVSEA